MNSQFLTSKYDIVFKTIFCDEDNHFLMTKLLEDILKIKVKTITFLNKELEVKFLKERRKIVDSLVLVNDKLYVQLEVNSSMGKEIYSRNFCFFSNIISTKTVKAENYSLDEEFIHIDLSYRLGKKRKVIEEYKVRNKEAMRNYVENVKLIEINMDKILNIWYTKDEKQIEKYKYFIMLCLNRKNLEKLSNKYKGDKYIMKYQEKVIKLNENEQFRRLVSYEEDFKFRENTAYINGEKKGQKKGIKQGIEKVAQNMLKDGCSVSSVAKYTNLSEKTISELQYSK